MSAPRPEAPDLRVAGAQVGGIFVPLADCVPSDALMGGYAYLDRTVDGVFHPGADLNSRGAGDADLGAPVMAAVDGVVEFVRHWDGRSTGYGTYVVVRTESPYTPETWLQHCHLDRVLVAGGQRVAAGAQLGTCGKTGFQTWAHLHWEVCHARKPTWDSWPYGWSVEQIERYWLRPADWFWAVVAAAMAGQGGSDVDVSVLNGAQQHAVMVALWGSYPLNMDAAIPKVWLSEWTAGRYRGRPVSDEQPVPPSEDRPGGVFQVFEGGCAVWVPDRPASWSG